MKVLATFPGKYGDSLWAMPTLRALSEGIGEPVDLLMTPKYDQLLPLYRQQPYIGRAEAWPTWQIQEVGPSPMTPWSPFEHTLHHEALGIRAAEYDHVVHLGYRTWPPLSLPHYVYQIAQREYPTVPLAPLDLERPWIADPGGQNFSPFLVICGWTDEHFELKVGLNRLLDRTLDLDVLVPEGSRWATEGWPADRTRATWVETARAIAQCQLFVGDCSALHVLAVALGRPCVIMEPSLARHNPIFWPLGTTGRVHLVLGNDGRPTFDARAVAQAIQAALQRTSTTSTSTRTGT